MPPSGPRPEILVGVVLAAGASRRMGRPKALLDLDGAPLVGRQVEALATACDRVRVVVGADAAAVSAALPPPGEAVLNPAYASTGPRESLLLALDELPSNYYAIVTPVDVPPAPAWVLGALLASGSQAVPRFQGEEGHPVLVEVGRTRALLAAGQTLREALQRAIRVDLDWPDTARNLNTPEAWRGWLEARRAGG